MTAPAMSIGEWATIAEWSMRVDEAQDRAVQVANATAVIWKLLLVAEKSFRRLSAPERLRKVHLGVVFVDGVRKMKKEARSKVAA